MKLLYVLPNLNVGGVSRVVNELATGMMQNEHQVIIVTLNEHYRQVRILNNIKIIELKVKYKKDLLRGILKLINIIKFEKPDIVHSHTVYSHIFVRVAKIFCTKPKYIASEHGTMNYLLSKGIGFKLMKFTNSFSDLITNVSQSSVESYVKYKIVNKNKIICVYNGIDLEEYYCLKKTHKINKILYVGRISKEKNLHLLIDFLKALPEGAYKCDIVGDGDQLEAIKQYAVSQNVENKVIFLGKRLDVPDIMKEYDILILTSFTEGLPTVLIEAIASKLLVLSTDCGGVKEILEGFEYLVVNNNDKNDLLNKFLNLEKMDLDLIRESLYQKIKNNFSKQIMISVWENIYQDIVENE
ncbi:glycosyltransferase [Acinetobacter pecorum]|uniref:Glycosyltransferase n=1 Tax=Acinetobacter pecorum TaxID=2762215 RepID=A0ABR8VWU3_9GAMM|nr:glycosyltransferase [Acinetobacter pecorum]MBD8009239.1 glycosyltransferase [Acinetobacter pecorum]